MVKNSGLPASALAVINRLELVVVVAFKKYLGEGVRLFGKCKVEKRLIYA